MTNHDRNHDHTEDCVRSSVDCEPLYGQWNQPPDYLVVEATGQLDDDAPWCRIRALAWTLADKEEAR